MEGLIVDPEPLSERAPAVEQLPHRFLPRRRRAVRRPLEGRAGRREERWTTSTRPHRQARPGCASRHRPRRRRRAPGSRRDCRRDPDSDRRCESRSGGGWSRAWVQRCQTSHDENSPLPVETTATSVPGVPAVLSVSAFSGRGHLNTTQCPFTPPHPRPAGDGLRRLSPRSISWCHLILPRLFAGSDRGTLRASSMIARIASDRFIKCFLAY